jgi:hypothetical protein
MQSIRVSDGFDHIDLVSTPTATIQLSPWSMYGHGTWFSSVFIDVSSRVDPEPCP